MILVETTTIHLLDREQSLEYWRQRQGYGKLSLWDLMITDVWRKTVPSAGC